MEHHADLLPRGARVALYIIWLIMSIITPFVSIIFGGEIGEALIISTGIVGAAAGVTAITHPTKPTDEEAVREAYEQGYNEAYYSPDGEGVL